MSTSFRVYLDETERPAGVRPAPDLAPLSRPNRRFRRVLAVVALVTVVILLAVGVVSFLYYQSLKKTPQYSLALLVDAAKRDDKPLVGQLVDSDAVVDDFVPQITDKAIELYGRGQSPAVIAKVTQIAQPILPAVKERARAELPRAIRSRTQQFGYVPFFAMVMGAERYLDIQVQGDDAMVKSKLPERKLEMKMRRDGDRWRIVGVKDEQLATNIAQTLGQQIMVLATKGVNKRTAETLGVGNIAELLRQAEELVK